MGNQVERVHEAAVVEHVIRHVVANGTIFTAAERHVTGQQLHTHQQTGRNWKKKDQTHTDQPTPVQWLDPRGRSPNRRPSTFGAAEASASET